MGNIVLNVYYYFDDESRDKFIKEVYKNNILNKVREEEGNIKYEFALPYENENTLVLLERWKDKDCLERHLNRETVRLIIEIKEKYGAKTTIEKFEEI